MVKSDKEMNIENITSNGMNLSNNGRFMQIEIYEKEIKRLQQELQRKDNIIKFIKQYINDNCWGYAGIDEDGINILLDKIKELERSDKK